MTQWKVKLIHLVVPTESATREKYMSHPSLGKGMPSLQPTWAPLSPTRLQLSIPTPTCLKIMSHGHMHYVIPVDSMIFRHVSVGMDSRIQVGERVANVGCSDGTVDF